jgi:hypothetical protein
MKIRIIKKNSSYIPQFKMFCFWNNFYKDVGVTSYLVEFCTLDTAIKWVIEKNKPEKKEEVVAKFSIKNISWE